MPLFFYKNSVGNKEQIFPLVVCDNKNLPSLSGFVICENQKAEQLTIHNSCLSMELTNEELQAAKIKHINNLISEREKLLVNNPS
jgi:hypothetical protein